MTLTELINLAAKKLEDGEDAEAVMEQIGDHDECEDLDKVEARLAAARHIYRLFATRLD